MRSCCGPTNTTIALLNSEFRTVCVFSEKAFTTCKHGQTCPAEFVLSVHRDAGTFIVCQPTVRSCVYSGCPCVHVYMQC